MQLEKVIAGAKSYIGVKESPANSNNVEFNTWYYGRPVSGASYPWCAVFVSYVFDKFAKGLVKKTASCAEMGNEFKKNNMFFKNPEVGDIVFFKFSTNKRWTNHVGIVVEVKTPNSFVTVEGNTSCTSNDNGGSVMVRSRTMSNVVGFGRPAYDKESKTFNVPKTVKKGSVGITVRNLQALLSNKGYDPGPIDGEFGEKTRSALVKFQTNNGLTPDGICGPLSWTSLLS